MALGRTSTTFSWARMAVGVRTSGLMPDRALSGEEITRITAINPTPKSVAMIQDAILDVTLRGEIVLDPCAGSATTLVAAHKVKRIGIGIEIDPLYVDLGVRSAGKADRRAGASRRDRPDFRRNGDRADRLC